jgi:hypothetical protein
VGETQFADFPVSRRRPQQAPAAPVAPAVSYLARRQDRTKQRLHVLRQLVDGAGGPVTANAIYDAWKAADIGAFEVTTILGEYADRGVVVRTREGARGRPSMWTLPEEASQGGPACD